LKVKIVLAIWFWRTTGRMIAGKLFSPARGRPIILGVRILARTENAGRDNLSDSIRSDARKGI